MDTGRGGPRFLGAISVAHGVGPGAGIASATTTRIEAALDRVFAKVHALCGRLSATECLVLGKLLDAVRGHPLIGEAADATAFEEADQHIPDEVKPSRRRGSEIARVVLRLAGQHDPPDDPDVPERAGETLTPTLVDFVQALDTEERLQFRELVSNALGGLSPSGEIPRSPWHRAAWEAGVAALATTGACGAALFGRSTVVSDERFAALAAEADVQYWLAVRMGMRMTAPAGRIARAIGADPELGALVSQATKRHVTPGNGVTQDDNGTYLYYDAPGDGVQPHIDPFGLINALVMIEHVLPGDGSDGSALVLHRPRGDMTRIPLTPGELVVLEGAGTVHSRERMKPGERVVMLSLVFH